ncbi:glycerophosphodiester phosphodiesterase family protein [Microbacterium sp. K24]|uniref:glycerophosphodiester phosphodiesterase n=1 Tax=Microbacterium sp. K24 TaxID=2305446 RepID=UPI00109C7460|nr:glycerophosphodiester phosphodiesterase family protein [Microbacterium sp. K24]
MADNPFIVAAIDPVAVAEQAASIVFPKPSSGLLDGDVLAVPIRSQGVRNGEIVLPSGWERGGLGTVPNDRSQGIFYKAIPTVADETAVSYTFSGLSTSTSRIIGKMRVIRGADLAHLNDGGVAYDTDASLPATTAGGFPALALALFTAEFTAGVSVNPTTPPVDGWVQEFVTQTAGGSSPAPVTPNSTTTGSRTGMALFSKRLADTTALAALTNLWSTGGSPTDPKSALWIVRGKSDVVAPRGFNSVAEMRVKRGATWAHRGGSASYIEHSLAAYAAAAARGYGVLEVSLQRTSDGVWFALHNLTLAEITGNPALTQDVRTMTWAQVNQYQMSVPGKGTAPFMRWQDFIAAGYGNTHVLVLDPKNSVGTHQAEFLAMVAADVDPARVIMKWAGGLTSFADAAKAAGFKTAGYWYQADYDNGNLAAQAPFWDYLGMDLTAGTAWTGPGNVVDLALAQGKKVWGHIAATQADYNTAMAKGADFVQSSGVSAITAIGPSTLTAAGSLVLTGSASRSIDTVRPGVGSIVLGGAADRSIDVARTASGALVLTGAADRGVDVERAVTGGLSLTGSAERTVDVVRSAAGVLILEGSGEVGSQGIVRTAAGDLVLNSIASRVIDVARSAVGPLSLDGSTVRVVGIARTASGGLVILGAGTVTAETEPFPDHRTLTALGETLSLTPLNWNRTLEEA